MLAALGLFVFELHTAPYQQLQRATQQRWATNTRIGKRPAAQYLGPGDETIQLTGTLRPILTGGRFTLVALNEMAQTGMAWPLVTGDGYLHGLWVIEDVNETHSEFFDDGVARKIDFSLSLRRVDDERKDLLGLLIGGVLDLFA